MGQPGEKESIKIKVSRLIDSNPELATDLLRSLIKRPSVNPWFSQEYSGGEKEAQLFLGEYLKDRLGAEVKVWEPSAEALKEYADGPGYYPDRSFEGRPNVSARVKGSGGGRSLLLFGHMDVVEPAGNWSVGPFDGEIKGGRLYGRGASDMKGGLAAQVAAVEYLKKAGIQLKGDVLIGSVVEEESGGMGTLAYVA
ncbi:MAG: M20/M25/M40 family metallo-hydrolase, partial [Bacillota bacterium]